ncbi:MAG: PLP-dependent aminotransferase family protein [Clostridiales bacterium]
MNIKINRNDNSKTLVSQVYEEIKSKIHNGIIIPSQKIPSTRQLSKDLQVSRNVIVEAYEQLYAEGYIKTLRGSGTFINNGLFLENYKTLHKIKRENIKGLKIEPDENIIDFRTGVPNLSMFPKELWGKLYKKVCQQIDSIQFDYHEPRGCYDLRYELAVYLKRTRGILCQPSQVIITTGAAQSFSMIGEVFNNKDKKNILVEDPLSKGILECLEKTDLEIHTIPVDLNGMNTKLLPKKLTPNLIFTTPSHQFPTGSILSIKRRVDLIEYARKKSSYIVEDDYDSEFRFEGFPIKSMQSLAPERVIYVGTFSKILCPALRLAYIIVPEKLIKEMCYVKSVYDIHSPILEQLTLSVFIKNGYLDKHIRKLKGFYKRKVELITNEIRKHFNNNIYISGNSAGIHLVLNFKNFNFQEDFIKKLENNGLRVQTVEKHAINKGNHMNEILMGYGNLSDEEIIDGIKILRELL